MHADLIDELPEEDRRALLAATSRRRYRKGETIVHEGDPADALHLLAKGRVAIRRTTTLGDVVTVNVLAVGSNFGELALVEPDARRSASVVALEPTETLVLTRAAFDDVRRVHPHVSDLLLRMMGRRIRELTTQVVEALHLPAEARVTARLTELAALYPEDRDGSVSIPLTQEDVATMAGTTRPTANRVLQDLVQRGVVTLSRGRITVIDRTRLADVVRPA
jgi:CRP-like cAMP-binding protein